MICKEMSVKQVNESLARVTGMQVQEGLYQTTGGNNGSLRDPSELRIEDTNRHVMEIAGGLFEEELAPKKPIHEEQVRVNDNKSAFEQVRDSFIPELSEASDLHDFKDVLTRMNRALRPFSESAVISEEELSKQAAKRLAQIQDVLDNGAKKVDGAMLDSFTAYAVMETYKKLSGNRKEKLMSMKMPKMANLVWKMNFKK